MKPAAALLALFLALPAAAAPQADARELLDWLHAARDDINRAGKAKDKVALGRLRREAVQRLNAWPESAGFPDCRAALKEMVDFLNAYQRKDYAGRDRNGWRFRRHLAGCEHAVAGNW
ncbi:hypothetical protein [Chromobacterium phragmitis]|uniref:Uncharacterized protein n=1 Tax=Chromobacterium phragmitis TaxID=2202141 RepID=A0ABV0J0S7_9NEIS